MRLVPAFSSPTKDPVLDTKWRFSYSLVFRRNASKSRTLFHSLVLSSIPFARCRARFRPPKCFSAGTVIQLHALPWKKAFNSPIKAVTALFPFIFYQLKLGDPANLFAALKFFGPSRLERAVSCDHQVHVFPAVNTKAMKICENCLGHLWRQVREGAWACMATTPFSLPWVQDWAR